MQNQKELKLNKVKINELIYPLNKFGRMGKIHSIFNNSFNIKVKDQLLHVGSYKKYISSFGMYIPKPEYMEMTRFVEKGNNVKLFSQGFLFYSYQGIREVQLTSKKVISLKISPLNLDFYLLNYLISELEKRKLTNKIGLEMTKEFSKTIEYLESPGNVNWNKVLNFLIGRGKGLTPSGDDFLVAYLFVIKLFELKRAEELTTALSNHVLSTTDVSKAYLLAAMKGYVSSPIYEFYLSLLNSNNRKKISNKLENILHIGHTSGKDMAFGILVGLKYVRNTRRKLK